ncbi:MAG: hypothetical protein AB7P14_28290 [Blastocatellales bacterium]
MHLRFGQDRDLLAAMKFRRNRSSQSMARRIRVEIKSRNEFWHNAVKVEWDYQYPQRGLAAELPGFYLIEESWFADLQRVAAQCFSEVLLAPRDPGRRQLFRRLFARDD